MAAGPGLTWSRWSHPVPIGPDGLDGHGGRGLVELVDDAVERRRAEEALRAYTSGAAHSAFREKDLGTLEAGKLTDLVIIDRNIVEGGPDSIAGAKIDLTMVGGRIVYERPDGENSEAQD